MCVQAFPHFVLPLVIHLIYSELAIGRFHLETRLLVPLQPLGLQAEVERVQKYSTQVKVPLHY